MGNSSPGTEGEQFDRHNLDLPGVQEDLIKEIASTGTPVVQASHHFPQIRRPASTYGLQAFMLELWGPDLKPCRKPLLLLPWGLIDLNRFELTQT